MELEDLVREARASADPIRAEATRRYFKTAEGEYCEGDRFLGLTTPVSRSIAKRFVELHMSDVGRLLESPYHEERSIALLILVGKYGRADAQERAHICDFYLKHMKWINNWDLVDISAPKIVGPHLFEHGPKPLFEMAKSKNIWERRIAILASLHFIKQHECGVTLRIATLLLDDKEDLIHKAIGWMLREVGKESAAELASFLRENAAAMPRTMLRYAIEKYPPQIRKAYLEGKITEAERLSRKAPAA
ncbi:DNA alkylation repair protein [bacterium]|nr:DNA alkylation repair protein [bacterium]